jgi:hypothetical protein
VKKKISKMKKGHLNMTVRDEGFGSMDLPGLT